MDWCLSLVASSEPWRKEEQQKPYCIHTPKKMVNKGIIAPCLFAECVSLKCGTRGMHGDCMGSHVAAQRSVRLVWHGHSHVVESDCDHGLHVSRTQPQPIARSLQVHRQCSNSFGHHLKFQSRNKNNSTCPREARAPTRIRMRSSRSAKKNRRRNGTCKRRGG